MRTSSEFGNAEVLEETYDNIKKQLSRLDTQIVPGVLYLVPTFSIILTA